jgi:hypothetical protein
VLIGYATPYLVAGFGGIVTPHLLLYGRKTRVLEHLWLPMIQETLPVEPGADSADQAWAIIERLDDYFRSAP